MYGKRDRRTQTCFHVGCQNRFSCLNLKIDPEIERSHGANWKWFSSRCLLPCGRANAQHFNPIFYQPGRYGALYQVWRWKRGNSVLLAQETTTFLCLGWMKAGLLLKQNFLCKSCVNSTIVRTEGTWKRVLPRNAWSMLWPVFALVSRKVIPLPWA